MTNKTLEQKIGNEHGIVRRYNTEKLADLDIAPKIHNGKTIYAAKFKSHDYMTCGNEMDECWQLPLVFPMEAAFRPATTSESISIVASDFIMEADNSSPLIAGEYVAVMGEGLYINPPNVYGLSRYDLRDHPWDAEDFLKTLHALKDKAKKINEIYLGENDFAFVPINLPRKQEFIESPLARALEHTEGDAINLGKIANGFENKNVVVGVFSYGEERKGTLKFGTVALSKGHKPYSTSSDYRQFLNVHGLNSNPQGFSYGILEDKNIK